MIFNNDLIFIHNGKTGGMSCSDYLLRNLRRPVFNCHRRAAEEVPHLHMEGIEAIVEIKRHCTLAESLAFISQFNGRTLSDFQRVVGVIRHPFTLEYSFYKHLQKPQVRERRKKNTELMRLADLDFKTFVKEAGYHRRNHPQEAFFSVDGEIPPQVELVKFEELSTAFPKAVAPFLLSETTAEFPHHNRTAYESSVVAQFTDEVRELLYRKHQFMFDRGFYSIDVDLASA